MIVTRSASCSSACPSWRRPWSWAPGPGSPSTQSPCTIQVPYEQKLFRIAENKTTDKLQIYQGILAFLDAETSQQQVIIP